METVQRQEFLDIVVRETERLTRLINEVLDLAKIESGGMEWRLERLDLREVIEDSVAAVSQLFNEREVHLTHDSPSQPANVMADRDRITQVVINLLSNAGKFCQPKSGEVLIRVSRQPGGFQVDVRDNGPGIPPDQLEHIFEKFHQVSDEQSGKPKGTGLGLAISERIVEYHRGRIRVQSKKGEGTTFTFSIPEAEGEQESAAGS